MSDEVLAEVVDASNEERSDSTRRAFLRFGGAAAAAAAITGLVGKRAEAANGGNFLIGSSNVGTATTQLSGGSTLKVVNGTSDSNASIVGTNSDSDGIGVLGVASGSLGGAGVVGQATDSGSTGVEALNSVAGGWALYASGAGLGVYSRSTGGPSLFLEGIGITVPPTSGSWSAGSFLVKSGALWYCYGSGVGSASKWVRISSALKLLSAPDRAYDSRSGAKISNGQERTISLTGAGVPAGSSAALVNLTVTQTVGSGFLALFAANIAWPGTSSINWFGNGQNLANEVTVALNSSGQLKVRCGGGPTHFIIDVIGYMP